MSAVTEDIGVEARGGRHLSGYKWPADRLSATVSPATMKLLVLFALVAVAAAWPNFGMMADSAGGK